MKLANIYYFCNFRFNATHVLRDPDSRWDEQHRHGHRFTLTLGISGPFNPDCGQVSGRADIVGFVETKVLPRLHNCDLNSLVEIPSAENLCLLVADWLKAYRGAIKSIEVRETNNNSYRLQMAEVGK